MANTWLLVDAAMIYARIALAVIGNVRYFVRN